MPKSKDVYSDKGDYRKSKSSKGSKPEEARAVEERLGALIPKHRDALNAEIKRINPDLVLELAVGPAIERAIDPSAFFSDWPDTWNDGDRWVKTWGKGGDRAMLPLEELRERMQLARTRAVLKR